MAASTELQGVEIQTRQCAEGYMAWVAGHHQTFATGRSPKEAIGALVVQEPQLFGVRKVNFR